MSGTGHYTQMVWASTYKIGCGYAAYRKRNFVKKFIVCNYGDDHVISTRRQIMNLVSNFEYLLLLCFSTAAEF